MLMARPNLTPNVNKGKCLKGNEMQLKAGIVKFVISDVSGTSTEFSLAFKKIGIYNWRQ